MIISNQCHEIGSLASSGIQTVDENAAELIPVRQISRIVAVSNKGENSLWITCSEDEPNPSAGIGIKLLPGGYWESPFPIRNSIKAVCDTGETTKAYFTEFNPI